MWQCAFPLSPAGRYCRCVAAKIFLLSPARCDGKRAKMILSPNAKFDLAVELRRPDGAPIGDVFTFLSGLYFRGKIAYATAFGSVNGSSVRVITTNLGLLRPE